MCMSYDSLENQILVQEFAVRCHMKTRRCTLQIRLASVEMGSDPDVTQKDVDYMNCRFRITRGDYSRLLELVVQDLAKAKVKGMQHVQELEMNWLLMYSIGRNRNNSRT
jgi:hypothetical protein